MSKSKSKETMPKGGSSNKDDKVEKYDINVEQLSFNKKRVTNLVNYH